VRYADIANVMARVTESTVVEDDAVEIFRSLRPDATVGELVCWAWVIDAKRTHTLMVHHRRFDKWLPPGGRANGGEDAATAAQRELLEETGIGATLVQPWPVLVDVVRKPDPEGRHVYTFGAAHLFVASLGDPLVPEADQPAQWWPLDAPPARVADHHWRRLRRAVAPG
jgi:8-oxo-dGTP pyrophosphatase MutT (NUDIX family)